MIGNTLWRPLRPSPRMLRTRVPHHRSDRAGDARACALELSVATVEDAGVAGAHRSAPCEQIFEPPAPTDHAAEPRAVRRPPRRDPVGDRVGVAAEHLEPLDAGLGAHVESGSLQRVDDRLPSRSARRRCRRARPRPLSSAPTRTVEPTLRDEPTGIERDRRDRRPARPLRGGATTAGRRCRTPRDLSDQREHLVALHRIEAVGRFVEQHERRIGRDRLGELDPLALPGRHRAERAESFLAETRPATSASLARPLASARGMPRTSAMCFTKSEAGMSSGKHVAFRAVPDERSQLVPLRERVEAEHLDLDRRSGRAGRGAMLMNVVLPAPFAPTSPVTPLPRHVEVVEGAM